MLIGNEQEREGHLEALEFGLVAVDKQMRLEEGFEQGGV